MTYLGVSEAFSKPIPSSNLLITFCCTRFVFQSPNSHFSFQRFEKTSVVRVLRKNKGAKKSSTDCDGTLAIESWSASDNEGRERM